MPSVVQKQLLPGGVSRKATKNVSKAPDSHRVFDVSLLPFQVGFGIQWGIFHVLSLWWVYHYWGQSYWWPLISVHHRHWCFGLMWATGRDFCLVHSCKTQLEDQFLTNNWFSINIWWVTDNPLFLEESHFVLLPLSQVRSYNIRKLYVSSLAWHLSYLAKGNPLCSKHICSFQGKLACWSG